jgi:hypothetical protein
VRVTRLAALAFLALALLLGVAGAWDEMLFGVCFAAGGLLLAIDAAARETRRVVRSIAPRGRTSR